MPPVFEPGLFLSSSWREGMTLLRSEGGGGGEQMMLIEDERERHGNGPSIYYSLEFDGGGFCTNFLKRDNNNTLNLLLHFCFTHHLSS